MIKYLFVLFSIGAYGYVSNQDFKDQSRAEAYAQVQQTQSLQEQED